MKYTSFILRLDAIVRRELRILRANYIYAFCMVVAPVLVTVFFTSLMHSGVPTELPVGIVDLDNSTMSRSVARRLDAFQTSHVVARYNSVDEARRAIQSNEIQAFLYFPKGTMEELTAGRQPSVTLFYNMASIVSGSLLYRDLRTVATLGSAAAAQGKLKAKGLTDRQIQAVLQPVLLDVRQLSNPWTNYNIYLSTVIVPGVILLFVFLITPYSIGTELKFSRSRQWLHLAGNNIGFALLGKLLPQTIVFLSTMTAYVYYVFGVLDFPHPGGFHSILILSLASVIAAQGFGVFMFGLLPSLRMSMSLCSLWGVLSFSIAGSAFPVDGMDAPLQSLSWLFPLRHYFMVYQTVVFNDYEWVDAWFHIVALAAFAILPFFVLGKLKNAMLNYVYIP